MEWVLILVAVVAIFFISKYLKTWLAPRLSPKIRLLLSFSWFVVLMTALLIHDYHRSNFTLLQKIVLMAFCVGYLIYFYVRFRKLNSANTF